MPTRAERDPVVKLVIIASVLALLAFLKSANSALCLLVVLLSISPLAILFLFMYPA